MKTIAQIIHHKNFPLELLDLNGNERYYENSKGYWSKIEFGYNGDCETYWEDSAGSWQRCEFDDDNNEIYYQDSTGLVNDNRP